MKSRRCRLKGSHEPHPWNDYLHDRFRGGRPYVFVKQVWCNGKDREKAKR